MDLLALIHEQGPCSGVFADVAAERGDTIEEWSMAWGTPPPRPLDDYDAIMAFGGVMDTHEEHHHPWLREENMLMQRFLDQGVPLIGLCLGGQLIAKAAHAAVTRAREPEIGWCEIELLPTAASDPVFGGLPGRFVGLQWHYYGFDLPSGAVALAESPVCLQAFRLGEAAWALQFHCEVTGEMLHQWADAVEGQAEPGSEVLGRMREGIDRHLGDWNAIGREICSRFLTVTERRVRARASASARAR
jgi:GMP synthase (glutamine-hydrolysing)